VGSALRRTFSPYWVRNTPQSIEHMTLQQAVVTRALLALPRLRSLHVWKLVDSAPLRSASLSHLALHAQPPLASAFAGAELPGALDIEGIDGKTTPAELLSWLSPLGHAALSLTIQGRVGNHHWTGADFAELEPIFGSIAGLTLNDPLPGLEATLPAVRRLSLKAYDLEPGKSPRRARIAKELAKLGLKLRA
jgi:hypothetical protein